MRISYLHESCSFLSDAHNVSTQQVLIEMFVMMHFIFKTLFETVFGGRNGRVDCKRDREELLMVYVYLIFAFIICSFDYF